MNLASFRGACGLYERVFGRVVLYNRRGGALHAKGCAHGPAFALAKGTAGRSFPSPKSPRAHEHGFWRVFERECGRGFGRCAYLPEKPSPNGVQTYRRTSPAHTFRFLVACRSISHPLPSRYRCKPRRTLLRRTDNSGILEQRTRQDLQSHLTPRSDPASPPPSFSRCRATSPISLTLASTSTAASA